MESHAHGSFPDKLQLDLAGSTPAFFCLSLAIFVDIFACHSTLNYNECIGSLYGRGCTSKTATNENGHRLKRPQSDTKTAKFTKQMKS